MYERLLLENVRFITGIANQQVVFSCVISMENHVPILGFAQQRVLK